MKRITLLSAALLLLASLPAKVAAAPATDISAQCRAILSLTPVSPYVEDVLVRAEAGLAKARAAHLDNAFNIYSWAGRVGSAWAKLIDSQLRLTVTADDLMHNSACLRFDMAAIECKMDEVRHTMNAQLNNGSFIAILQLEKLLDFLNNRYAQLATGAHDPYYSDPYWSIVRDFDPDDAEFNEMKCPYNSDYGPPQINGYGCDLSMLGPRRAFTPLNEEYDSLLLITNQLNDYRTSSVQFLEVQQSIDELFQTSSPTPPAPEPWRHIADMGCKWVPGTGLCTDDSTVRCENDMDCGEGGICEIPTKVCEGNRNMACFDDSSCIDAQGYDMGPCVEPDNKKPATTELRGPFFLGKNHLELLLDFLEKRVQEGHSREFDDELKIPEEFPPSQSSLAADRADDFFLNSALRNSTRYLFALWSRIQGSKEAASFPYISDPALEVAESLSNLRTAIGDLARLTRLQSDKDDTLRAFTVKFASFLKKTCVYRPCNASLDAVLKIVFTDECFPYANGEFLNNSPGNPRWDECKSKAGITFP